MRTPTAWAPALECAAGNTSEMTAAASRKQKEVIDQLARGYHTNPRHCLFGHYSRFVFGPLFLFCHGLFKKNCFGLSPLLNKNSFSNVAISDTNSRVFYQTIKFIYDSAPLILTCR